MYGHNLGIAPRSSPGRSSFWGAGAAGSVPRGGDRSARRCPTDGSDSVYFAPQSLPIALAAAANSKSFSLMPPASWVESESVTRL